MSLSKTIREPTCTLTHSIHKNHSNITQNKSLKTQKLPTVMSFIYLKLLLGGPVAACVHNLQRRTWKKTESVALDSGVLRRIVLAEDVSVIDFGLGDSKNSKTAVTKGWVVQQLCTKRRGTLTKQYTKHRRQRLPRVFKHQHKEVSGRADGDVFFDVQTSCGRQLHTRMLSRLRSSGCLRARRRWKTTLARPVEREVGSMGRDEGWGCVGAWRCKYI